MVKNFIWYQKRFRWWRLRINRRYKDRLFRFLFRNKKDLLELYNAVNGSSYSNEEELEIITLNDVIFMKMKNDLSFMIAEQLNLYEHQSTYSPNMPLRGLMYFAQQYEGLIAQRKDDIYGTRVVKLPTPEYVIFYNGKAEQADRKELFLSDAFEDGRGSGCLECKALLLNINRGHNKALMEKCRRLWEYSEFIAEVNENLARKMSFKAAVMKAIDSCIEKGILEDVLRKNRAEVLHMLLTEYDENLHLKNTYREGYEEGEQAGYNKGEKAGEQRLLERMIQKKLQRGKSIVVIADELEIDLAVAEEIISKIKNYS